MEPVVRIAVVGDQGFGDGAVFHNELERALSLWNAREVHLVIARADTPLRILALLCAHQRDWPLSEYPTPRGAVRAGCTHVLAFPSPNTGRDVLAALRAANDLGLVMHVCPVAYPAYEEEEEALASSEILEMPCDG